MYTSATVLEKGSERLYKILTTQYGEIKRTTFN